ncbi:MAG: sigma-70 family RNA polymerase sigma factor [Polyangiaceae bacterium]
MRRSARQASAYRGREMATVLPFPVPQSDVGLVRGLRAGQSNAVRALCDRHGTELIRVAMRVLGPDPQVHSVVGEAVNRALSALDELEDPRELRHWLVNHLISAIRQRLRSRRKRRWFSLLSRRRENDEVLSGTSERQRNTYRQLDRLNDEERIVLCLTVFDGMEPSELATVLSTSVARVRRLLDRAELRFARLNVS